MPAEEEIVDAIFCTAIELAAPGERAAYVKRECGEDVELQRRVEALIAAHFRAGNFLESPVPELVATSAPPSCELLGTIIGPYRLLQQIGEGGMGTVYLAEQTAPVQRKVAVKIIKLGMDTWQVIARFEAERQTLALMDHPNIAKMLEAGTTDQGRLYFVMELVKGISITNYCDQHRLSTKQRLDLFITVCAAVQHAHQKGIIHRDLKPNNVLVADYDDRPVAKIIDFGVAKAVGQPLTERTMFTQFGQVVGTIEYMSPEQAKLNQVDIDTRTDIYSLGVLLYELLTGETPFDHQRLCSAAFDEMLRIIREEEPPKPSTRLNSSESLPSIAAQRQLEPKQLALLVSGDLDWIVMKSLEKDRNRRYETANGLAQDIGHYLADEPVQARRPTRNYRLRKFIRRNKVGVFAGAAIAASLVIGMGISTWMFFRERSARQEAVAAETVAKSEAKKSQQVAQFLKDMLEGARQGVASGRDTTLLREIVDRTAQRVGSDLKDQPEVEVELRRILGWVYEILGKYEQAEAMFREAVAVSKNRFGNDHPDLVASLNGLGFVLTRQEKLAEAEATYRDALSLERNLTHGRENLDLASSLNGLAGVLAGQGKLQEAEAMYRDALALRRKFSGNDDPFVANTLANLANLLCEQGKLTEAEAMYRNALAIMRDNPGDSYDTIRDQVQLAAVLQQEGKLAEAEAMYRNALAMQRALLGSDHPFLAPMLEGLASVLRQENKATEAEAMYREALSVRRNAVELAPNSPRELSGLAWTLATCPFMHLREPARAVELATRATELVPQTGSCWSALGVAEYRSGQFQKSIEALQKANELRNGGDGSAWYFLAMAHWQLGRKDEARQWYDRATKWTDKNEPGNEELLRFRTEAAKDLGITQSRASSDTKLMDKHAPKSDP